MHSVGELRTFAVGQLFVWVLLHIASLVVSAGWTRKLARPSSKTASRFSFARTPVPLTLYACLRRTIRVCDVIMLLWRVPTPFFRMSRSSMTRETWLGCVDHTEESTVAVYKSCKGKS